jgi:hypothetical protein
VCRETSVASVMAQVSALVASPLRLDQPVWLFRSDLHPTRSRCSYVRLLAESTGLIRGVDPNRRLVVRRGRSMGIGTAKPAPQWVLAAQRWRVVRPGSRPDVRDAEWTR